jgi:subtilisin family serine protease
MMRQGSFCAWLTIVVGVVFVGLVPAGASGQVPPRTSLSSPTPAFVPGELIVRLKPGVSDSERAATNRAQGASQIRRLQIPRASLVRVPVGRDVRAAAAAFERDPDVAYAEPNFIGDLLATIPNDPSFNQLWGLHNTGQTVNGISGSPDADIDAPEGWDSARGSNAVRVGIADSGIAYTHPDLAANIWLNPGESGGGKETNGLDDDSNGYIDDLRGYDFADGDSDPVDVEGHGTHVAGTVGAVGNNAAGVTGVNWNVRVAALRVCGIFGQCEAADVADGFAYAGQMGLDVVNASFGIQQSQAVADAITGASDTLFVAAAGNETNNNDSSPRYPCNYPSVNVVCVAATDQSDQLASFSNWGSTSVDLGAPGTNVLSTYPFTKRFEDLFQAPNFSSVWTTGGTNSSWQRVCSGNNCLMSDNSGSGYLNNTNSFARTTNPIDLTTMNGCGLQYILVHDLEQNADFLRVEVSTNATTWTQVHAFTGTTTNPVFANDSLGAYDGQATLYVRFRLVSNGTVTGGGAAIDNVAVRCRRAVWTGPQFEYLQGTSMASPHVAGAAALLLSKSPGETPASLKAALLDGVDQKSSLLFLTVTGGRLNINRSLQFVGGYPRPAGASPVSVSLVPAYNQCTSPNRTHGPPDLPGNGSNPDGSCRPPVQSSSTLTVGTAEVHPGLATNSTGRLRLKAIAGNPTTPADEADVSFRLTITDVRRKSDLGDYTGQIEAVIPIRITDRLNAATSQGPFTQPGTVEVTFRPPVGCAATGSSTIGATCSLVTTVEAMSGNAVPEGKRSVWGLGQVSVNDGGADGVASTTPNTVFARQGVFVP